jgi:hypothetical protein
MTNNHSTQASYRPNTDTSYQPAISRLHMPGNGVTACLLSFTPCCCHGAAAFTPGVEPATCLSSAEVHVAAAALVFLNGNILGLHRRPRKFVHAMRWAVAAGSMAVNCAQLKCLALQLCRMQWRCCTGCAQSAGHNCAWLSASYWPKSCMCRVVLVPTDPSRRLAEDA